MTTNIFTLTVPTLNAHKLIASYKAMQKVLATTVRKIYKHI